MSMTDPIGDMLTRIRNAMLRRKERVEMPASNIREAIARILVAEGFIQSYRRVEGDTQGILRLYLKYGENRERVISGLRRISKPGQRVYADKESIPRVLNGLGIAILSTSQGVLSDKECRRRGIGGEVVCTVW